MVQARAGVDGGSWQTLANPFAKFANKARMDGKPPAARMDAVITDGLAAIAVAAARPPGTVDWASAIDPSLLVNGLSKLTSDPACRDGIAAISTLLAAMENSAVHALLSALDYRGALCNALGPCARADRDSEAGQCGLAAAACCAALERIASVLMSMSCAEVDPDLLDFALILRGLQCA